jgi:acetoin utilization deacetylase AcuC-like enzyme
MEEETRVFTFSMHGATNYPFHKEKSDLDIGLKDGTSGQMYFRFWQTHCPKSFMM